MASAAYPGYPSAHKYGVPANYSKDADYQVSLARAKALLDDLQAMMHAAELSETDPRLGSILPTLHAAEREEAESGHKLYSASVADMNAHHDACVEYDVVWRAYKRARSDYGLPPCRLWARHATGGRAAAIADLYERARGELFNDDRMNQGLFPKTVERFESEVSELKASA